VKKGNLSNNKKIIFFKFFQFNIIIEKKIPVRKQKCICQQKINKKKTTLEYKKIHKSSMLLIFFKKKEKKKKGLNNIKH